MKRKFIYKLLSLWVMAMHDMTGQEYESHGRNTPVLLTCAHVALKLTWLFAPFALLEIRDHFTASSNSSSSGFL
jgi:hypothetical protein